MAQRKTSIARNFSYQLVYQVFAIIVPFVTAPYIARVLGKTNNGIYSYTYVIVSYFVVFAVLGLETYGNRSIARAKTINQDKINEMFSEILAVQLSVSLVVMLGYLFFVFFLTPDYKTILLIQTITLLGSVLDIGWFFFGLEQFRLTSIWNIIVKIISVTCIFIFVKDYSSLPFYVIITALETFLSKAGLWLFVRKYVKIVRINFLNAFKKHLKPILVLFAAVFATSLYRMVDKLMLGYMVEMGSLGCYEYADKIIKAPLAVITALGTVMLPRMSVLYANKNMSQEREKLLNLSSKFVLTSSFAMAFGVAAIAKEFVLIFLSAEYTETIDILMILCVSLPFMGWNNMVRTQILMPNSKDRVYFIAVWAGAIIDVVLNAILIPVIGTSGAAIATVLCYAFTSFGQVIPIEKEFHIVKYLKSAIFPLIIGCIMFAIVRVIGNAMGVHILTLLVQVIAGAFIYILLYSICAIFTHDDLGLFIKGKILEKVGKKTHE